MITPILRSTPLALLLALVPAAQGPAPPVSYAGDQVVGAAAGAQDSAVLSPGADSTLAVWTDTRSDLGVYGPFTGEQTSRDIYATRLDANGNALEATPIPLAVQYGEQTSPRAAWDGQQWLVTWLSQTATQFFYDSRVFGIRVGADGTLLDPEPFEILSGGGNSLVSYDLASNGENWLVIAQADTGGGIRGRRVSSTGSLLDPALVTLVAPSFFLFFNVQLESAAGEYLLTFDGTSSSLDDWQARRFDGELNQLGAQFNVPLGVEISAAPMGYLLVRSGPNNITAQRMLPDGTLFDVVPIQVTAPGTKAVFGLQTVFDGTLWWVGYDTGGISSPEIRASRVTVNGQALDPTGVAVAPSSASIYFTIGAAAGGGLYTVWEQGPGYQTLRAALTSADTTLGAEFPLAVSAPSQEFADSTPWSGGHALAWTSYSGDGNQILVQLTDDLGRASGSPILVATGAVGAVGVARIAWNGALFLVTWSEGGQVRGRRLLPDGSFLDASPLQLMSGASPDVGALGENFLVVATRVFPGLGIHFVHPYAVRIAGATGAPLDPAPQLIGQYYARYPRVSTAGDRWLVTWQRNYSHDNPGSEIRATFIDAAGAATPDFFVGNGGTPQAASSESNVMFVWRSGTSSSSNHEILARLMGLDGTFEGAVFTAATAPNKQQRPTIAWTGVDYFVAWEDLREAETFFDARSDVYGGRFSESGGALDGNGIPFLAGELPVNQPALSASNGVALLTASELDLTPGIASYRLRSTVANALVVGPAELSLSGGGTQDWTVRAGTGLSGHLYWVLGTFAQDGQTTVGDVTVLLELDDYFSLTLQLANSPIYPNSLGVLDAMGNASAGMSLPPGADPSLAGLELHHALVVFEPTTFELEWGGNQTSVQLVP